MRKSGMVLLPSKKTLRAYTGSSIVDVGVTELVKQRLLMKKRNLSAQQLKVHLIVNEAAVKPV